MCSWLEPKIVEIHKVESAAPSPPQQPRYTRCSQQRDLFTEQSCNCPQFVVDKADEWKNQERSQPIIGTQA